MGAAAAAPWFIPLLTAGGEIGASALGSAFAPNGYQERESFAGTSADPASWLGDVRHLTQNLLSGSVNRLNEPISIGGSPVAPTHGMADFQSPRRSEAIASKTGISNGVSRVPVQFPQVMPSVQGSQGIGPARMRPSFVDPIGSAVNRFTGSMPGSGGGVPDQRAQGAAQLLLQTLTAGKAA